MASSSDVLLSAAIMRSIGDKMYEKRKMAALEVEQVMKELAASGARDKVESLLGKLINDYARSGQANKRKGGLLCLAAATVALRHFYDRLKFNFLGQVLDPVCLSLSDQDGRVRYYACEALYNIVKAMQEEIISNQDFFLNVFRALFSLYGDMDGNVQNAAQHLDRVLKDSVIHSSVFDVSEFVACLKTNLVATNVHKRQFLIGWVDALCSVSSFDLLIYLPDVLPGLMDMLEDEHGEVRKQATQALEDFLDYLLRSHTESMVNYTAVLAVLLEKCKSEDTETCLMALKWLSVIVEIASSDILSQYGPIVGSVLSCISHSNLDVQRAAQTVNAALLQSKAPDAWTAVDMQGLLSKINRELSSNQEPTRLEALRWLEFLLMQCPSAVLAECESIVNAVLDALAMHWDRVVKSGIHLLALLAKQMDQFRFVMDALLQRFQGREGLKLLHSSGAFIIQSLCSQLGAKAVFSELAIALEAEKFASEFTSTIVQSLNILLITSPELIALPQLLRRGLQDEEARQFFLVLFPAWSHSVCAVLTICFLVRAYGFAWKLILDFGNSLYGASADAMVQIVRLVKLIEAPAFGFLRLELIQHEQNPYLLKCLHGLMMLLPQTDAFHTLVDRLKSLPTCAWAESNVRDSPQSSSGLDEEKLVKIFAEARSSQTTSYSEKGWGFVEPYPTQVSTFSFARELSLRNMDPTETQST